ncbi:MAG: aspartate 1-decarboxylase [Deltaproteobacteria bacterium]|nr:aspartate 1-decarboxylase [Deltaproteobacteria bacterium]
MPRMMFKSKIHRATITESNLDYEGSMSIDVNLMELADILPYEMIHIYNINNGARFETYAIEAERGSGTICLNGAAARMGCAGDLVIICTYQPMDDAQAKNHQPVVVKVDSYNHPLLDHQQPRIVKA